MPTSVALLRGINVGGRNSVSMEELGALFESLGHTEVRTVIQSGNVIFSSEVPATPRNLEIAINEAFGVDITVVLRTPAEIARVVATNPFAGVDPAILHVGFLSREPAPGAVAALEAEPFMPEELAVSGSELYFKLPNGMGRARLPGYVHRQLGIPTTVRNWKTVTKLVELTRG